MKKTLRGFAFALLVFAAILVSALAAAVVWRVPLAEFAYQRYLAFHGVEGAVEIVRLERNTAELRNLRAGHLSFDHATIEYRLGALQAGRVESAALTGLRATLDLRGDGPLLGELQNLLPARSGNAAQGTDGAGLQNRLGALALSGAEITLRTRRGDVPVRFEAAANPREEARHEATVSFAADTAQGLFEGHLDLLLEALAPVSLDGWVSADLPSWETALTLELASSGLAPDRHRIAIALEGELGAAAAELLPGTDPARPPFEKLSLSALGHVEVAARTFDELLGVPAWGLAVQEVRLEAAGTEYAEHLALTLEGGVEITSAGLAGAFGLIAAAEAPRFPEPAAIGRAEQAAAQLHLDLRYTNGALTLTAEPGGSVSLSGAVFASELRSDGLAGTVQALRLARDFEGRFDLDLTLAMEPSTLIAPWLGESPAHAELAGVHLELAAQRPAGERLGGTLDVTVAELALPERELSLRDLRLNAPFGPPDGGSRPAVRLREGRLVSRAEPAAFAPLALSGVLARDLSFEAQGTGANGVLRLTVRGRHDVQTNAGSARLVLDPLHFAQDGLQPEDLAPFLFGAAQQVSGTVAASSDIGWRGGEITGGARLEASGLHLRAGAANIEDLDFTLVLDSLFPPGSPAEQRFRAARIQAGVILSEVEGSLRVMSTPDGDVSAAIESLEADVMGGRLSLRGAQVDPARHAYRGEVMLEDLELASLLAVLGVPELEGSGRLSGVIPVEMSETALVVQGGQLTTTSPGRIAFDHPVVRQALAAGGEAVELMLDALQDFHYEEIQIRLDQPPTGAATLALRLQGANPEVLDGYPFDININLETEAQPLLDSLYAGQRILQLVFSERWLFSR